MACIITVDELLGVRADPNAPPHKLQVSGTAEDCQQVLVVVLRQNTAAHTEQRAATVQDGAWSLTFVAEEGDFAQGDFVCDDRQDKIEVTAVCAGDPDCRTTPVFTGLACRLERGCPTISGLQAQVPEPTPANCNPDGTLTVTVSASVTPGTEVPVFVVWRHGSAYGAPAAIGDDGQTISDSFDYPAGTHSFGVEVVSPEGCEGAFDQIEVPACPEEPPPPPASCPTVGFAPPEVGDRCNAAGEWPVTVSANVAPAGTGTVAAELVLWDPDADDAIELLASDSGSTEFALTASRNLAPGAHTVRVRVTEPAYCGAADDALELPQCPEGPGPEPVPEPEPEPVPEPEPDRPPRRIIDWCAIALGIALALLVLGAVLFGVAMCLIGVVPEGTVTIIVAIIAVIGALLLVVATIALLIWLFLCGSCRQNCLLLDILIDVLILLVSLTAVLTLIGALLDAAGLTRVCWVGWAIDTIDIGLLLLVAYWYARLVGCRPWPRWVPESARVRLPDAFRVICS